MHQLFYALTIVLILAWIVLLITGIAGGWAHLALVGAIVCMGIGLFRRSAGD
jgi:hypothetical protein